MLPIRYVILEGPDCSGKTSLYSSLHRKTSFKYNIQDRSCLSMLCYARLYGRNSSPHRQALLEELCDANNAYVVLMPEREVVLQRLAARGDEFQDKNSLLRLYDIFQEELSTIESLPNVFVVRENLDLASLTEKVSGDLNAYELTSPESLGRVLRSWSSLSPRREVQFRSKFEIPTSHTDHDILDDPYESVYYAGILRKCEEIVRDELVGKNPYSVPQSLDSRRFFYSSDSCISAIHFMLRDGDLSVHCTLRSTDSIKNGAIDLRFLAHLSTALPATFGWNPCRIFLHTTFNSLHIRSDAV